jgi:hypothetical protein
MLVLPLPVADVRDGWDWLIVGCTIFAALASAAAIWVAVIAILRADRITREDRAAAVRERRNVFELGVLIDLIKICGLNEPGSGPIVQGLLRVLPAEDMRKFRDELTKGGVPSNETLLRFLPEYNEAVDRRLRDGEAEAVPPRQRLRDRLPHPFGGS